MKTRNLLMLIVLAVAVVLVSIWLQRDRSISREAVSYGPLAPELKDGINAVNGIRIVKPGNTPLISVVSGDDGWVVREKYDYPADVGKVRQLLLQLSLARIIERKTSDPELYARLGVQDIENGNEESSRRQLELDGLNKPVKIIIGHAPQDTADATYVRRAGEEPSWLINNHLTIDDELLNWLDRSIIDLSPERVHRIVIEHSTGKNVILQKTSSDDFEFMLQNIPEGREKSSGFIGNSVASAIAGLSFEEVKPAAEFNIAENSDTTTRFETFDGMVITVELFKQVDANYAHFSAEFDRALIQEVEQGGGIVSAEEVEKQASKLNRKLSDWVYDIPNIAYESMTKTLEDFLVPREEATKESEDVPLNVESPP